jgi:hypothetical protein
MSLESDMRNIHDVVNVGMGDKDEVGSMDVCVDGGLVGWHQFVSAVQGAGVSRHSPACRRASAGQPHKESREVGIDENYGSAIADLPCSRAHVSEGNVIALFDAV